MIANRRIEVQTRRIAFWLLVLVLVFPGESQTTEKTEDKRMSTQDILLKRVDKHKKKQANPELLSLPTWKEILPEEFSRGRIVRPTIGFPTIQQVGKTFVITISGSKGSKNPEDWKVRISTDYDARTIGLDVLDVHYWVSKLDFCGNVLPGGPFWDLEVKIRENTRPDLYDLTVQVAGQTYTPKNAVQVIKGFTSTPTFVQMTDVHIGFTGRRILEEPDVDEIGNFERVVRDINLIHPDFVVITGDLVDWANDSAWQTFHNLLTQFRVPVYTVVGNHDYYTRPWWETLDGFAGGVGYGHSNSSRDSLRYYLYNINSELDYTFDYGPIRLVFLNSGQDVPSLPDKPEEVFTPKGSGLTQEQLKGLQNVLRTGTRGNFIFMHHPVMRKAGFIDTTEDDGCIRQRDGFIKLCKNTGSVAAVFSGHTHKDEYFLLENTNDTVTDLCQTPSATLDGEYRYRWVKVTKPERGIYATEIRAASAQPNILGKWVYEKDTRLAEIVSLQFEKDGTVSMNGPMGNVKIRTGDCSSGQWEIGQGKRIIFSFTEQGGLKATGQIDVDRIREFKIGDFGEGATLIKSPDAEIVRTTSEGKVWSEYVQDFRDIEALPRAASRIKIRADKTFLATVSVIWRWEIVDGSLVKFYGEDENGNIIQHSILQIKENKLVDKVCASSYVRAASSP